jgi:hypothetical protein
MPGQSVRSAEMQTELFVTESLDRAVELQLGWEEAGLSGVSRTALSFFGDALHAVTDSASREHAGSQEWGGMGFGSLSQYMSGANFRAAGHGIAEFRQGNLPGKTSEAALGMAKYEAAKLWSRFNKELREAREKKRKDEEEKKKREEEEEKKKAK